MSDTDVTLDEIIARTPHVMTRRQEASLRALCARYGQEFRFRDYGFRFDLPVGYVAGWVGGSGGSQPIYVGVDPEGRVSS